MYPMNKNDYRIIGDSWQVRKIKNNFYVPVTNEQAAFVNKDRAKNGPAVLKYLILSTGIDPLAMGEKAINVVRDQQKAEADGASAYVPPPEGEVEGAPAADKPAAPVDDKADKAKADLLKYVEGLKGKQLLAFAMDNLKLTFDGAPSRDDILSAVRAKVESK